MNFEQCECKTDSRSQVKKHMDEKHATSSFCNLCHETFSFIRQLWRHKVGQQDVYIFPKQQNSVVSMDASLTIDP